MQIHSKPGLADLKRLRQRAQAADTPVPARPRKKRRNASDKKSGERAPPPDSGDAGTTAGVRPETATEPLTAEDKALFRQAVKSARPLAPSNRAILPPAPTAPAPILKQRRQAAAGAEAAAPAPISDHYASPRLAPDASHFVQAGYGPDLLKKLAKGQWPIGASLDLHGATLDEARLRMDSFLRSCLQHGIRCVRIVHGKGHGSRNNAPVLKETVRRWLTQLEDVMAYAECDERDGGAGAVQVLLRANEKPDS
ncbi:Smr/MutS family protein [Pusillimonas sp.]|uniref:Smr/MutS family protein n=1 Tax=Pusillimonas sp. TaxID=3040095 RepID=UPI0029BDF5D4|nr:Smr/MutS family protein [Pusillimonas sp.]MDX3895502.1 Smr/MutS family protein [Pusillimonas sp.]